MLGALLLWVVAQDTGWTARPAAPTVGDTVWLERRVAAPPGWTVRPGRLMPGGVVEPISDPIAVRDASGWMVRYPVVAWAAGSHTVALPVLWRLGPAGEADSAAGGLATVVVASVLPDTGTPVPRPARDPLRLGRHGVFFPAAGAVLAGVLLAAGVRWRRRAPRAERGRPPVPPEREVADDEWLAAGEPGAVAARATAHLRAAIARAVPEAHAGLTTEECLAVLARARPGTELGDIAAVLRRLDEAAFGGSSGTDVAALAKQTRVLGRRVGR